MRALPFLRLVAPLAAILTAGCASAPAKCGEPSGPTVAPATPDVAADAADSPDTADGAAQPAGETPGAAGAPTPASSAASGCGGCFDTLEPYGLVTQRGKSDVPTTVDKLKKAAEARGFTVIATIDHAAAAKKAGLELDPTVVVIFGKPEAGTPLMKIQPTVAIDLPLHVLVWTMAGKTAISYDDPAFLNERHQLGANVDKMKGALSAIVADAAK